MTPPKTCWKQKGAEALQSEIFDDADAGMAPEQILLRKTKADITIEYPGLMTTKGADLFHAANAMPQGGMAAQMVRLVGLLASNKRVLIASVISAGGTLCSFDQTHDQRAKVLAAVSAASRAATGGKLVQITVAVLEEAFLDKRRQVVLPEGGANIVLTWLQALAQQKGPPPPDEDCFYVTDQKSWLPVDSLFLLTAAPVIFRNRADQLLKACFGQNGLHRMAVIAVLIRYVAETIELESFDCPFRLHLAKLLEFLAPIVMERELVEHDPEHETFYKHLVFHDPAVDVSVVLANVLHAWELLDSGSEGVKWKSQQIPMERCWDYSVVLLKQLYSGLTVTSPAFMLAPYVLRAFDRSLQRWASNDSLYQESVNFGGSTDMLAAAERPLAVEDLPRAITTHGAAAAAETAWAAMNALGAVLSTTTLGGVTSSSMLQWAAVRRIADLHAHTIQVLTKPNALASLLLLPLPWLHEVIGCQRSPCHSVGALLSKTVTLGGNLLRRHLEQHLFGYSHVMCPAPDLTEHSWLLLGLAEDVAYTQRRVPRGWPKPSGSRAQGGNHPELGHPMADCPYPTAKLFNTLLINARRAAPPFVAEHHVLVKVAVSLLSFAWRDGLAGERESPDVPEDMPTPMRLADTACGFLLAVSPFGGAYPPHLCGGGDDVLDLVREGAVEELILFMRWLATDSSPIALASSALKKGIKALAGIEMAALSNLHCVRTELLKKGGPHEWIPLAHRLAQRLPRRMKEAFEPDLDRITTPLRRAPEFQYTSPVH